MAPDLSVIIVNYNGLKYLKACLDSLIRHLDRLTSEIIVVDNNSADESVEFIKANYPQVILLETNKNLGFGKGNNLGVKSAKSDTLLLINNDTIVQDNLLPVFNFLQSNKDIGVVGINMLNKEMKYLPATGIFPTPGNLLQLKKLLERRAGFKTGTFSKNHYEVDWLVGSFLMLSKKIYEEIMGFDEDYYMYVEDIDFCRKIADKGYKRIFLPAFSYIHFVGYNQQKNLMLIDGYRMYVSKHLSGITKMLCQLSLQINSAVKKTRFLLLK